jgi:acetyltransferase-like isoleucine patch superfamily enzyme
MSISNFVLKLKRAETPFFRTLKRMVLVVVRPRAMRIPGVLKPPLRLLYETHFAVVTAWHTFWNVFYFHPLFQARCKTFGKNVVVDRLPFVLGHVDIHVGNDIWLGGGLMITSGRVVDQPVLTIQDHAQVAWNVQIVVSKEVVIEEYAMIAHNCRISDTDGHPREADLRAKNEPVKPRDIRPVRISRHAWIGNSSHIMKGVTIGEGAVIGANSVVISDIPPYCLAMGNPAEVLFRNFGKPSKPASPNT